MPADAVVIMDYGCGRLSLNEAKFADLSVGATATAKLPTHRSFAMLVKVEGPTNGGLLKAMDAEKRTVDNRLPRARHGQPRTA